ncbi:DUF3592 domain-containing protein [Legionella worsleiensis]|uniref:DUF3592 domain-containing protein n=1 Tax=Legionella worsleiensis TaxID=45076 RepID=A0A0W1AJI3_9GAMM|nr:DUF3592 domain-containing protein [Legionella worsleiensis]KTD81543.1 hypothetical protein Lwor_0581 [Legionella worsleiensis]STY32102.1 Protein of uncharacterised function (DUF3592) [Legionella worsleiensis]
MNWLNSGRWVLDVGWLIILSVFFIHFWRNRSALVQSRSWLQVKGHITRCEWTRVGHSLWPKIEYLYQVQDRELTGEYLFLDTSHNNPNSSYSRRIAYKAALAFKENSEIDVYYNPNKPEQSALDVTIPVKLNFILVLLGVLIAFHLGFIIYRLLG